MTAGFRKMKLPVPTAAPPMAPVKSQGMVRCLDANHFLGGREGQVGTEAVIHTRAAAPGIQLSLHRTSASREWEHAETGQGGHVSQHTVFPGEEPACCLSSGCPAHVARLLEPRCPACLSALFRPPLSPSSASGQLTCSQSPVSSV